MTKIPLHEPNGYPGDVSWIDEHTVAVALVTGAWKVNVDTGARELVVRRGKLPGASPYPALVAADGSNMVVIGGGIANYLGFDAKRDRLFAYGKSAFYARDVAVADGRVWYLGWMGRAVAKTKATLSGALWVAPLIPKTSDYDSVLKPIHEILENAALRQWRVSTPPYAGSIVTEPNGTIDVMTSVEPGVYRYDANGHLIDVLCPQTALPLDMMRIGVDYGKDVEGRYRKYIDHHDMLDDLVFTPQGVALLVRKTEAGRIRWELWTVDEKGVTARQRLATSRRGPFGHMRCEARGYRMACVLSTPDANDAAILAKSQRDPILLIYDLH